MWFPTEICASFQTSIQGNYLWEKQTKKHEQLHTHTQGEETELTEANILASLCFPANGSSGHHPPHHINSKSAGSQKQPKRG